MPAADPASPFFHMPLYRPGTVVQYAGKRETVGYVMLRRSVLLVHLVGRAEPVDADKLSLVPSRFALRRMAEKPVALVAPALPASAAATLPCAKPLPRPVELDALEPNRD